MMFDTADPWHQPWEDYYYLSSEDDERDADRELGPLEPEMFLHPGANGAGAPWNGCSRGLWLVSRQELKANPFQSRSLAEETQAAEEKSRTENGSR